MDIEGIEWKIVAYLALVYIALLSAALLPFAGALLLIKWIFF